MMILQQLEMQILGSFYANTWHYAESHTYMDSIILFNGKLSVVDCVHDCTIL